MADRASLRSSANSLHSVAGYDEGQGSNHGSFWVRAGTCGAFVFPCTHFLLQTCNDATT